MVTAMICTTGTATILSGIRTNRTRTSIVTSRSLTAILTIRIFTTGTVIDQGARNNPE
jgi:hypothetical protein